MTQVLASIVIASHNYARFLPTAIESALSQTYTPTEIIVVDDGSTDTSVDVIDAYESPVRKLLKSNGGQASAWNAGFSLSQGELIIFLDADDVLAPTAVERAMAALSDGISAKAHWQLEVIDETGQPQRRRVPSERVPEGDLQGCVEKYGPGGSAGHVWPPSSGNAWARGFLQQVFPIPEAQYQLSPDLYVSALAPLYGQVRAIAEPQSYWRVHGTNSTWREPFDSRLETAIALWEATAAKLEEIYRRRSIPVTVDSWRQYAWYHRIRRALDHICGVVPSGSRFILIDGGEWETDAVVRDRRCIPFVEREGMYWGPPTDDESAIGELERLRAAGAQFLVIAWNAFWWLEHYRQFSSYLDEQFQRVCSNDLAVVVDLASAS